MVKIIKYNCLYFVNYTRNLKYEIFTQAIGSSNQHQYLTLTYIYRINLNSLYFFKITAVN